MRFIRISIKRFFLILLNVEIFFFFTERAASCVMDPIRAHRSWKFSSFNSSVSRQKEKIQDEFFYYATGDSRWDENFFSIKILLFVKLGGGFKPFHYYTDYNEWNYIRKRIIGWVHDTALWFCAFIICKIKSFERNEDFTNIENV